MKVANKFLTIAIFVVTFLSGAFALLCTEKSTPLRPKEKLLPPLPMYVEQIMVVDAETSKPITGATARLAQEKARSGSNGIAELVVPDKPGQTHVNQLIVDTVGYHSSCQPKKLVALTSDMKTLVRLKKHHNPVKLLNGNISPFTKGIFLGNIGKPRKSSFHIEHGRSLLQFLRNDKDWEMIWPEKQWSNGERHQVKRDIHLWITAHTAQVSPEKMLGGAPADVDIKFLFKDLDCGAIIVPDNPKDYCHEKLLMAPETGYQRKVVIRYPCASRRDPEKRIQTTRLYFRFRTHDGKMLYGKIVDELDVHLNWDDAKEPKIKKCNVSFKVLINPTGSRNLEQAR